MKLLTRSWFSWLQNKWCWPHWRNSNCKTMPLLFLSAKGWWMTHTCPFWSTSDMFVSSDTGCCDLCCLLCPPHLVFWPSQSLFLIFLLFSFFIKRETLEGWDISGSEVLDAQGWRPESHPQNPHKSQACHRTSANPLLWTERQTDPRGFLVSERNLCSLVRLSERPISKNMVETNWGRHPCQLLALTCIHRYMYSYTCNTYMRMHMHTHTL